MKQKIKFLLKIILTIAILWFVLYKIEIERLKESLKDIDLIWLFIAFMLFNLSKVVSSFRLNIYFKAMGLKLSEKFNLTLYYVGMFYNLFLPGGIGGDGYKVYLLNRYYKKGIKQLFKAILLDRISGLFALIFLSSLLFVFSDYSELLGDWGKLIALMFSILLFPIAYFLTRLFFNDFLKYFNQTLIWGFVVQLLQLLCALSIIKSLYIDYANLEYLILFLLSNVVAILPLTIGGVGVRELTFLYGLEFIGKEPSLGVTFSFLFFMITAVSSLLGLFFLNRVSLKKGIS